MIRFDNEIRFDVPIELLDYINYKGRYYRSRAEFIRLTFAKMAETGEGWKEWTKNKSEPKDENN